MTTAERLKTNHHTKHNTENHKKEKSKFTLCNNLLKKL